MMRRHAPLSMILVLFVAVSLMSAVSPAVAEMSDREEKWQFYIPITYSSSESFNGQGGSSLDVSNDLGWGFAFGYNFNERWVLGFEITWLSANYEAKIPYDDSPPDGMPDGAVRVNGILDSSSFQIAGQFNFMESRVTPFVRASLGGTWTDTNIPNGPPVGTCWWHPWYGPICGRWQPTYDQNSFSYGAGLGVRADVGEAFYLELSYNQLWIDFRSASSTPSFNGGRLNVGWMF